MKIRLEGTKGECEVALAAITRSQTLTVVEASDPYPNRGRSVLVRVYLDVRIQQNRPAGPRPELPKES